jgi:hypothetical protein
VLGRVEPLGDGGRVELGLVGRTLGDGVVEVDDSVELGSSTGASLEESRPRRTTSEREEGREGGGQARGIDVVVRYGEEERGEKGSGRSDE